MTPKGFLETVEAVESLFINGGTEANDWAADDKLGDIAIKMSRQGSPIS